MEDKRYTRKELEGRGYTMHPAGDLMFRENVHGRDLYVFVRTDDKNEPLFRHEGLQPVPSISVRSVR